MKHKVWIDDFSWFDVELNNQGEAEQVIEHRVVWSFGKDGMSKLMSERVKRAIEQAKASPSERSEDRVIVARITIDDTGATTVSAEHVRRDADVIAPGLAAALVWLKGHMDG